MLKTEFDCINNDESTIMFIDNEYLTKNDYMLSMQNCNINITNTSSSIIPTLNTNVLNNEKSSLILKTIPYGDLPKTILSQVPVESEIIKNNDFTFINNYTIDYILDFCNDLNIKLYQYTEFSQNVKKLHFFNDM